MHRINAEKIGSAFAELLMSSPHPSITVKELREFWTIKMKRCLYRANYYKMKARKDYKEMRQNTSKTYIKYQLGFSIARALTEEEKLRERASAFKHFLSNGIVRHPLITRRCN